jgi:hypothetical protein
MWRGCRIELFNAGTRTCGRQSSYLDLPCSERSPHFRVAPTHSYGVLSAVPEEWIATSPPGSNARLRAAGEAWARAASAIPRSFPRHSWRPGGAVFLTARQLLAAHIAGTRLARLTSNDGRNFGISRAPRPCPADRTVCDHDFDGLDHSHEPTPTAATMPRNCARMNAGTPAGAMPAKVSDSDRAMVTAGFANEVEAVNQ